MSTFVIPVDLLQALLSPDGTIRSQAETAYQSLTVLDRITGLMPHLLSLTTTMTTSTSATTSLLATVLLRREIVKLHSVTHLQELFLPLFQAFESLRSLQYGDGINKTNNISSKDLYNQTDKVGQCLAEVCSSMTLLGVSSDILSTQYLSMILLSPSMQESFSLGHVPSLKLVSYLAEKVPSAFLQTLRSSHNTSNGSSFLLLLSSWYRPGWSPMAMAAWTQVVIKTTMATAIVVATISTDGGETTTTTTDDVSLALKMKMMMLMTDNGTHQTLDDLQVNVHSMEATLSPCLQPILEWLSHQATTTTGQDNNATKQEEIDDAIHSILQDLQLASVTVPSFLAGHGPTFSALVQVCLQLATATTNRTMEEEDSIPLAALQVLSSLLSVGDVKRLQMTSEMTQAMTSIVFPRCVQIMVAHAKNKNYQGDDDDQIWMEEPPTNLPFFRGSGIMGAMTNGDMMNEEDEDDEYLFALSLLESFMVHLDALGHVLPLAEQLLSTTTTTTPSSLSTSANARVGLSLLTMAVSASPMAVTPHIPVIIQAVMTILMIVTTTTTPSHFRIQYHALDVLKSLCETQADHILPPSIPLILEEFLKAVNSSCTKVSTKASMGIISFANQSSRIAASSEMASGGLDHYFPMYLPQLLQGLIQGPLSKTEMDVGSLAVRIQAIGAIAALAHASMVQDNNKNSDDDDQATFVPYFPHVMPGLLSMIVLVDSTGPMGTGAASETLSLASLEATTIIGQAVKKEVFGHDAHQLVQWMMPRLQQPPTASNENSNLTETMLTACARIASVLEDEFAPYVPVVIPMLLQRIQEAPDVSIVEGTESSEQDNGEDGIESMTVAVPGRGFTKVSINTSKIQQQSHAIRVLYEHAKALGGSSSFLPYIQQSFDILIPLVHFPYSSDVRSTSAQTLGTIMDVACQAGEEQGNMGYVRTYFPPVIQTIAQQLSLEDGTNDREALYALADSLSEVYYVIHRTRKSHPEIVNDFEFSHAEDSVRYCLSTLTACLGRRSKIIGLIMSSTLTGEDERQDYLGQLEMEQELLTPLVDSIGYALKLLRTAFVPIFEKYVLPILGPKLEDQSDVRATLSAVCLFDDVVEHCGLDAAATYAPYLMKAVVAALEKHSDEKELVQASVYGIAQMARHASSGVLSGHLPNIIHGLLSLTERSKEDAGDDQYLMEIAASALASLTLLGPFPDVKCVPRERLVHAFLSQLPILQDDDEAQICHAGFCHLIETGIISLSEESVRVAKIIGDIFVQVHKEGEEVATPDTVERLSSILYQMQQSLSPSTLQLAFGGMDTDAQQIAASILREVGLSRTRIVTP